MSTNVVCEKMIDQLLTAYAMWALVQGTSGIADHTDTPSNQMRTVLEKLTEIVSSRQNYHFASVLKELPRVVTELGWIIDNATVRSNRFLSALPTPLSVSDVYNVRAQKGTLSLLLSCYGHSRTVETPAISARKQEAILSAVRLSIFPRRILPEMFGDSAVDSPELDQGWAKFGPGDVSRYFDTRLDEANAGVLAAERNHFHVACLDAIRGMGSRIQEALNGGEPVQFPVWVVQKVACHGGSARITALQADGTAVEIAAGVAWVVTAAQLGPNVRELKVIPTEGTVVSLVT